MKDSAAAAVRTLRILIWKKSLVDTLSSISGASDIGAPSPLPRRAMASAFGSAVDTKIVNKPSQFTGEKSTFSTYLCF